MQPTIYFQSEKHRARFLASIQRLGKVYSGKLDPEYAAALFLLTATLAVTEKSSSYIDNDGIDFEGMLQEVDFSGGESVMVKWACNLFNGNLHIDPLELMRLDEENFQTALSALLIRRYGARLEDVQGKGN